MTDLMYYVDSYLREFDAQVVDSSPAGVVLDRTAFYPGGGGQPCDRGTLEVGGRTWSVLAVRKEGGRAVLEVEGDPPAEGARVHARLDWDRRYALMRVHTAMHVLCGVIWRDYSAHVTGGNMDVLHARMDFEFENMHQDLVREIEVRANREVDLAREVRVRLLPREQALAIPDLIRTKVNLLPEGLREIRVVEIVGLDLQADGGTHLANTREVGAIRIVDYKSKGRINKRLAIALE
ncbi:MAG: Ala-tRNA(Pro) hydrolase [Chloroflexi bacterium RBG_16_64_43]|nr:MAG: Ala-tRNA(Pro) hydrolase [Chloroflexi bacterium RBG_16_64_43]